MTDDLRPIDDRLTTSSWSNGESRDDRALDGDILLEDSAAGEARRSQEKLARSSVHI